MTKAMATEAGEGKSHYKGLAVMHLQRMQLQK